MVLLSIFSVASGYVLKDLLIGPGSEAIFNISRLDYFETTLVNNVGFIEWLPLWVKIVASSIGTIGFVYYSFFEYAGSIVWYAPM